MKATFNEGKPALDDFTRAMKILFRAPKEAPAPKRRRKKKNS
jgi:hypothetical protein